MYDSVVCNHTMTPCIMNMYVDINIINHNHILLCTFLNPNSFREKIVRSFELTPQDRLD